MDKSTARAKTIYIVDDQDSILTSVRSVLEDESYRALTFSSAEALRDGLAREIPDLILLDIWLPGTSGVEALAQLKAHHPGLPIILMSGHAGIDIAVHAMKVGAADFLEKPLNLDILLEKIAQHLASPQNKDSQQMGGASNAPQTLIRGEWVSLVQSKVKQKTIRNNAVMNGVGLLTGRPTGIIISPMPVNSGIVFRTLDGVAIPAHVTSLENYERLELGKGFTANSTALSKGGRRIRTVEHLLAALSMLGITNASIKVDEEIPNIDGSAADFCRIIAEAGIEEQSEPRRDVVVHRRFGIGNESKAEKHLFLEPFDGFEVELRVDYPAPIFEQKFRFNLSEHSFEKEIAPARSFNTFENIDMAQQQGVVGSGYLNSHIIIHDGKVINTQLKFPDEFVRHKLLDLLGDLFLLGYGIRGRVVGNMTSHGLNQMLAVKAHQLLGGHGSPA